MKGDAVTTATISRNERETVVESRFKWSISQSINHRKSGSQLTFTLMPQPVSELWHRNRTHVYVCSLKHRRTLVVVPAAVEWPV